MSGYFSKPRTLQTWRNKIQRSWMNSWINNNQPMILRMRCVVGSKFLGSPCWRQLFPWPYMVAGGPRSESPCRNATSVTLEMVCWGQRLSRRNGWTFDIHDSPGDFQRLKFSSLFFSWWGVPSLKTKSQGPWKEDKIPKGKESRLPLPPFLRGYISLRECIV